MQRWTSQALALPAASWKRADLEFEGVEHDGASFVVHVFLNNPGADDATPRTNRAGRPRRPALRVRYRRRRPRRISRSGRTR